MTEETMSVQTVGISNKFVGEVEFPVLFGKDIAEAQATYGDRIAFSMYEDGLTLKAQSKARLLTWNALKDWWKNNGFLNEEGELIEANWKALSEEDKKSLGQEIAAKVSEEMKAWRPDVASSRSRKEKDVIAELSKKLGEAIISGDFARVDEIKIEIVAEVDRRKAAAMGS